MLLLVSFISKSKPFFWTIIDYLKRCLEYPHPRSMSKMNFIRACKEKKADICKNRRKKLGIFLANDMQAYLPQKWPISLKSENARPNLIFNFDFNKNVWASKVKIVKQIFFCLQNDYKFQTMLRNTKKDVCVKKLSFPK